MFEIIPSIGYFVANVIRNFNFDPQKIELVGHSFGAHIAGYTGASLNGDIQKITGNLNIMDKITYDFDFFFDF